MLSPLHVVLAFCWPPPAFMHGLAALCLVSRSMRAVSAQDFLACCCMEPVMAQRGMHSHASQCATGLCL